MKKIMILDKFDFEKSFIKFYLINIQKSKYQEYLIN